MNKKDKLRLLRKHTRHNSLSERLFSKNPERYYHNPDLFNCKSGIWSLDDDALSYVWFLDNVRTREDLIIGLTELIPFADDALVVARQMSDENFVRFKEMLIVERRGEDSEMPELFRIIVLPKKIFQAMFLAHKARAPLGAALIRILEEELGVKDI